MSADPELDVWRRHWKAGSVGPDRGNLAQELRERVARESRWLRVGLIAPVLVTVLVGGGLILRALRVGSAMDIALAFEGWLFILVTWAGCIWIARGTWRPLGETTAAFIDLSIRRRQANLRAVPFGMWLYVGQLIIVALLAVRYEAAGLGAVLTSWPVIILGWIGLPALLAVALLYARRQRAELEHLLDARRQLIDD